MKISPHLYVLGTNCALKSWKKVQICKKVKDYKYLLLKQSTFFLGKKSNEEQPRRGLQIILGKNAKKIKTIDILLSLSSGSIRIVHNNRVMY